MTPTGPQRRAPGATQMTLTLKAQSRSVGMQPLCPGAGVRVATWLSCLMAGTLAIVAAPSTAFAGCEKPDQAVERCTETAEHGQDRCDDNCQAAGSACRKANKNRAHAFDACGDAEDSCKERCTTRAESNCDGVKRAAEKCSDALKLAKCKERWGSAIATLAACEKKESAQRELDVCVKNQGVDTSLEVSETGEKLARSEAQVDAATRLGKATFRDNGDGTLTQADGGLEWLKNYSREKMPWRAAARFCENLPLAGGGWRLPRIEELTRLIDTSRPYKQRIDAAFADGEEFARHGDYSVEQWQAMQNGDASRNTFWSRSPTDRCGHAWCVSFWAGRAAEAYVYPGTNGAEYDLRVRCVRTPGDAKRAADRAATEQARFLIEQQTVLLTVVVRRVEAAGDDRAKISAIEASESKNLDSVQGAYAKAAAGLTAEQKQTVESYAGLLLEPLRAKLAAARAKAH